MATDPPPADSPAPGRSGRSQTTPSVERALLTEDVELLGRMPWSSNATFLAKVGEHHAVYKPGRGERRLWDFPGGLYRREVAAYELAKALGWLFIPETVIREDAPLGEGSLQRFVAADFDEHYFTLLEEEKFHPQLQRIACFDVLANNADRKGGHCLLTGAARAAESGDHGGDDHIWGIDHGLCFHSDYKLRTVIWDFVGQPIPKNLIRDIQALVAKGLPADLARHLEKNEAKSLLNRAERILEEPHFPNPRNDHPYPWPFV